MAGKRHFSFENGGGSKRRCCDHGESLQEFMEKLDPTDLQLVQQLRQKYHIDVPHLSSRRRMYRLQFRNKLPNNYFTDRKFEADNGMEVEIVLEDASNKAISSGPMASAKVEIAVLDGDFHGDENGEWTEEEFEDHVIVARKDNKPLLIGNLSFKLCDGFGHILDMKFTDNSSWAKSKNFRLGAKLIGMAGEVQEGISNAFRVKDRRVEVNQKDRPPLMNDEVCCLKGISKKGSSYEWLLKNQVKTVLDFLYFCTNNPEKLGTMIGMPKGIWEKALRHAREGLPDFQKLNGVINLPAPDQNFNEITGSSSSQISSPLVQLNECEIPISDMLNSVRSLPAPEVALESSNSFKTIIITTQGVWKGKEQIDIPLDVLTEGNSRSYVSNKLDIGSLSLRHRRLKILFIAWLKIALRRSQKSKHSDTGSYGSEIPFEVFSPIFSIDGLMEIDDMNY